MSAACDVVLAVEGLVDRLLPKAPAVRGSLIVVVFMGFYAGFNAWAMRVAGPIDFPVYYLGAMSFLEGGHPYGMSFDAFREYGLERLGFERFGYPYYYPPLVATLVAPMTIVSATAAAWIWNMANAAAVILGTALLLGDRRWRREGLIVWGVTAAFVPTLATLYGGQLSGLLYLSVTVAIVAREAGRPMLAGTAVAFGALLKIVPVVLIGYFIWRGDWRAVAGSIVGAALIVALTLPVAGFDDWIAYFTIGIGTMHASDAVGNPTNITLNGLFLKLLSDGQLAAPLIQFPGAARPLWIISSIIVVAGTMGACYPPLRARLPVRYEIALIALALQLIAPYTWYLQLTLSLLPALVIVLMAWRDGTLDERWLWMAAAVLVPINVFGLAWHSFEHSVLALSVPVVVLIVFWIMLCAAVMGGLGRKSTADVAENDAPDRA